MASPSSATGFAVVDVETTGFSPETERIVEVAVVVLDGEGTEIELFCTLLDPGGAPGPTHIHGITAEMVQGAPTFSEIHPYLAQLLSGRILVGHNVDRFDLPFLLSECRRAGGPSAVPPVVVTLDTLESAWRHVDLPGKARLVDCCDYFGLTWDDHHSALGDARITGRLLTALRSHVGDEQLGLVELFDQAATVRWPLATPNGDVPPVRSRTAGL